MKVRLLEYTPNAKELLIFTKKTRLKVTALGYDDVMNMSEERKDIELEYVFGTIGSSWEFVDYAFVIEDVTRAFCLEEGTKILVRRKGTDSLGKVYRNKVGSEKIENIIEGDEVLSYNEKDGAKVWDKVIFTSKHLAHEWYTVKFSNGNELVMTDEHPVYVVGRNGEDLKNNPLWIPAKYLQIGDKAIQTTYLGYHSRLNLKGKTLEENFGKSKAKRIKKAASVAHSGTFVERYGKNAQREIEKRTGHFLGKTYEEIMGKEKADALKILRRKMCTEQYEFNPNLQKQGKRILKEMWKDEREKMIDICKKAGVKSVCSYFGKKSKSEEVLENILQDICPGEFKFNGDGNLGAIGFRLPDFINVNGKKKVIELFGCYWHGCDECGFDKIKNKEKQDKKVYSDYKKLGYECLVVWEHELKNRELLGNRLQKFIYNPRTEIVEVIDIAKSYISRMAYNIETEKNHNFFAYGILTHNTHQLVRHRVASFAQQAQRVVDLSDDFRYLTTGTIKEDPELGEVYDDVMNYIRIGYKFLIENGAVPQDARGVLPTNILTNICMKVNLRALSHIMNVRLCYKAQGEFQTVAKAMREEVLKVHPWTEPVLQVHCCQYGSCQFPGYKECPIKHLLPTINFQKLRDAWRNTIFEAQPKGEK